MNLRKNVIKLLRGFDGEEEVVDEFTSKTPN